MYLYICEWNINLMREILMTNICTFYSIIPLVLSMFKDFEWAIAFQIVSTEALLFQWLFSIKFLYWLLFMQWKLTGKCKPSWSWIESSFLIRCGVIADAILGMHAFISSQYEPVPPLLFPSFRPYLSSSFRICEIY